MKDKSKQIHDQTESIDLLEQKIKLLRQEIDLTKLNHSEEIEKLKKELNSKESTKAHLDLQNMHSKSMEPPVQIEETKEVIDSKVSVQQTQATEASEVGRKSNTESPEKVGLEPVQSEEPTKKQETPRNSEEVRKSQGGFLSSVASFFLTENERKKLIQE